MHRVGNMGQRASGGCLAQGEEGAPEGAAVDVALGEEAVPALVSVTGEGEVRSAMVILVLPATQFGGELG